LESVRARERAESAERHEREKQELAWHQAKNTIQRTS